MKGRGAKEIALTAVSCALTLIAYTLAVFVEPMTLGFYAISGIAMSIPLTKGYWRGTVLGYVVASICSFFINPINSVAFIAFFGIYGLIQWSLDFNFCRIDKLPKWSLYTISWVIKLAYFQLVIFLVWTFMAEIIGNVKIFDWPITYWLITIIGNIFFILYDVLMHFVFKNLKWFVEYKLKR